ncbi:MAG: glycosyltransferase, partial [Phycisphaerae bacterium]
TFIAAAAVRVVTLDWLTEVQVIAGWFRRRSYEFLQWLKSQATPFDCVIAPEWQGITYYALLARQQGLAFANTRFITGVFAPTHWRYTTRTAMPASVDALEVMFMEREVVRRADAAVISNSGLRDWLDRSGWVLPGTIQVIPPFPTLDPKVPPQTRKRIACAMPPALLDHTTASRHTSRPIQELVFAGRLDTATGVELFCAAIKRLQAPLLNNVKFSFIGTIGEVGQLAGDWYVRRALSRSGCQYNILAEPDPQRQLEYLCAAGRAAVFAAPLGAAPQLLVNCIAANIPVLIPENCGLRDYLQPAELQKICFAPSARGLAEGIQTVIRDGIAPVQLQDPREKRATEWESLIGGICASELYAPADGGVGAASTALPLISVCLVHYNRPATLRQAIASLQAQTYANFEVILVDDGSPSSEAQAFLDSLQGEFAARKWRIIRQENKYMWRARNNAAKQARGEYLAFMDDDNIAAPHWLAWAMQAAQRTHADVVTSAMTLFEGEAPPDQSVLFPIWAPLGPAAAVGAFMNVFGDVHCLMQRGVFEKLGGFEERFSGYQEDWEFFARAVLSGYKLELIPQALLYYRISKNSVSRSTDQSWNANRGCSIQPYLNAMRPELRDLIPFMLENQRLYSGVAAKRAGGRGKIVRQLNRWLRGR